MLTLRKHALGKRPEHVHATVDVAPTSRQEFLLGLRFYWIKSNNEVLINLPATESDIW